MMMKSCVERPSQVSDTASLEAEGVAAVASAERDAEDVGGIHDAETLAVEVVVIAFAEAGSDETLGLAAKMG